MGAASGRAGAAPPLGYRPTSLVSVTGQVLGGQEQTYLWTSCTNTHQLLGSLGGYFSRPAALNDSGVIVGESTSAIGGDHAFIYDPAVDHGRLRDLDPRPGYVYSGATGVNNSGSVVGASAYQAPMNSTDVSRTERAFVWIPTTHEFRLLEARSGRPEVANAINEHGIIAGSTGGPSARALLWNACGTSVQVLDENGFSNGAFGINRHEHVVSSGDYGHPGTFWRRNDGPCLPQPAVAR